MEKITNITETFKTNDLIFINNLFNELNKNYVSKFFNIFNDYLVLPGINEKEFILKEIDDDQNYLFILEKYSKDSHLYKLLEKMNFGIKLFDLIKSKMIIFYQIIFNLILTKDEEEYNFNSRLNNIRELNNDFISYLKESYKDLNYLNKNLKEDDDDEIDLMIYNINNNKINYNYTIENIFNFDLIIINENITLAIHLFKKYQKSKYDNHAHREFEEEKIVTKYSEIKNKKYQSLNYGYILLEDDQKYHKYINSQLARESEKYYNNKKYESYFNLIFLPFILRLDYSIKNKELDNNTLPEEFEYNHPYSPYSIIPLNKNFNLLEIESKFSKKTLLNNSIDLKESMNYRQYLSYISFIILYSFNFKFYFLLIMDHINESIEKKTIYKDPDIKFYDDPKYPIIKLVLNYHKNFFIHNSKIFDIIYNKEFINQNQNLNEWINQNNNLNQTIQNNINNGLNINEKMNDSSYFLTINYKIHTIIEHLKNNIEIDEKIFTDYLSFNFSNNFNQNNKHINTLIYKYIHLIKKILIQIKSNFIRSKQLFNSILRLKNERSLFDKYENFIYQRMIPLLLELILIKKMNKEEEQIEFNPAKNIQ